jgi:DNA-binding protein HU-beta
MKVAELEAKLAAETGMTKAQSKAALHAFTAIVTDALRANEKVAVPKLGTFKRVRKSPRRCYNPSKKEHMVVPEHNAPKFTPALELRKSLE